MKQALGLIEIKGLSTAILVADTMAKTANIKIEQIENTKGLGWMTIKIAGDVGAVNAAVKAGELVGSANQFFISSKVIPRPSDSVEKVFCQSTKKEEIKKDIDKNNIEQEVIEKVDTGNIKEEIVKMDTEENNEIVTENNEVIEQENEISEENNSPESKENDEQVNNKKQKSRGKRKKENTENTQNIDKEQ